MTSGEKPIFSKASCGLYRDDGLSVIKSGSFEANKIKLRIEELFRKEGLKIKVKANLIATDFLDVKFNLETGKYQPFRNVNHDKEVITHFSSSYLNILRRRIKYYD